MATTVVHCKRAPYDVYIGRPSKWGNPFSIGRDGTREEVIEKYLQHLLQRPDLLAALHELEGKVLGCWCAPQACHGDILAKLADILGSAACSGRHERKAVKQILDRVTVTGADDSIDPKDLKRVQEEFPFVEWGILVSRHKTLPGGQPRFPSSEWLYELCGDPNKPHGRELGPDAGLSLSVHLCGQWVRQVCKNDWLWLRPGESGPMCILIRMAQRIQFNFHGYIHRIADRAQLAKDLTTFLPDKQTICQVDGANDDIVSNLYDDGVDVAGLYDQSGGAGKLPKVWLSPLKGIYAGYAGGLSPENVEDQLEIISKLVTEPVWIDVETHVRSDNDQRFDLDKVHAFLVAAEPWVLK